MSQTNQITRFDEARAAGMTAEQAARWVAYVDQKTAKGEEPIALWEAVAQLARANSEQRIDRVLREIFSGAVAQLASEGLQVRS